MSDMIFQSSDLALKRVEVLAAARAGKARLRDKDGTSLVMLRESRLQLLEELASWNSSHLRLEELLQRGGTPSVNDLGMLAWLRVFDEDELKEFVAELHHALIAAHADGDVSALSTCINEWRTTARQLDDPLRRSVLRGAVGADHLAEVARPDGE